MTQKTTKPIDKRLIAEFVESVWPTEKKVAEQQIRSFLIWCANKGITLEKTGEQE